MVYGPNNGGKSSILKGKSSLGQTLAKVRLRIILDWSNQRHVVQTRYASPHIQLNKIKTNTEFVLGFVLQNDELQKVSGRKFHEIRFTFSLETNEGVLTSLEFIRGDFEDYLDPILTVFRDDSKVEFCNIYSTWRRRAFVQTKRIQSQNLMQTNVQMLDKQTRITTSIIEYTSMLTDLEDKDELQGLRYDKCAHCEGISQANKRK